MQNTRSHEITRLKLAQILQSASPQFQESQHSYSRNCFINEIFKNDFNINQKFKLDYKFIATSESRLKIKNHLQNCTALHLLSHLVQDIDTFTALLAHGADFTIKNENGQTVIHLIITQCCNTNGGISFIKAVLSAHVKSQNFINPRDHNGISHFHGACMADHVEAAELFLNNGTSYEEAVNYDAPQFAGWTPLHFAAVFGSLKVAEILFRRGADVNARTAKGESPLDLLFENYSETFDSPHQIVAQAAEKEKFLRLMIEKNAVSAVGLSSLHIACALKDLTLAEKLMDEGADVEYAVPSTSHIHPGHTALHFAANNGIEAVKMLLKRGAKFDFAVVQNGKPLWLSTPGYRLHEWCDILSCVKNLKDFCLSDGQSKLLDLISSMESLDKFRQFLTDEMKDVTATVPSDSILWPGYTILHLVVTFSRVLTVGPQGQLLTSIIEECLNHGASPDVRNLEGQTPIHLAYSQHKTLIDDLTQRPPRLNAITNLVDKNNLSYLHIACLHKDEALTERLLSISTPNDLRRSTTKLIALMEAGSTPLHAAVASGSRVIAELLLRRGADLHATDASGLTPIHLLYKHRTRSSEHEIAHFLLNALSTNVVDRVVDGLGLSYLHVAAAFDHTELIEKLLDLGSNVNAVIECQKQPKAHIFLSNFANYTPLHMALHERQPEDEVLDLLLRRGADVFANVTNKLVKQPIENVRVLSRFFRVLWDRDDMQKSMERRFGLKKLHVACLLKNEAAIRSTLTDLVDVNVRVNADSPIFAGCTPLHLLVTSHKNDEVAIRNMVAMLLDRGADVMIVNNEKATPIHVFGKSQRFFRDSDLCEDLLVKAHRDFSVNPVNEEGWSHFHLACYWHRVEIVEKFLQHRSVDINQPLDYFMQLNAGSTPLHLALDSPKTKSDADWKRMSQTVELLLKNGADITAKDVRGNTPLHTIGALRSPGMSMFEMLVSYGGDVKCENLQGQLPIQQLASISRTDGNPTNSLTIFKRYGFKINSWNRITGEGCIAKIFLTSHWRKLSEISEFKTFVKSTDARIVDDVGRTAIHNAVSQYGILSSDSMLENYEYAIKSFVKIGIDIEYKDESGQTALHYAARMKNLNGFKALLLCGADINVVDNSGNSPLSYTIKHFRDKNKPSIRLDLKIAKALVFHVQKLQHLKIEVNHTNQIFTQQAISRSIDNSSDLSHTFFSQVEMTKRMCVGTDSLTLYDFLSETAASTLYPFMLNSERKLVDRFFESINYEELKELAGIIKLQSNKMRTRLGLIDSAFSSMRILLGFSVPGLCEQISRFLSNSDLKNVMESTTPKTSKRKLSEISG